MLQLARRVQAMLCCCAAPALVRGFACACCQTTCPTVCAHEGSAGLTLWRKATPYPSLLPAHGLAEVSHMQGAVPLTSTTLQTHRQAQQPWCHWLLLVCAMHAAPATRRLYSVLAGAGVLSAAAAAAGACCICCHVEVKGAAGSH
jgi:hypothetical protein